jgi:tetratricopeptide (TPR) repeat protein
VPRYNLACVFAQLGRAEEAVEQLRVLRVTDQMKNLLETAERDPDMAPIRDSDAFQGLLRERETLRLEAKVEQLVQFGSMLRQESARATDTGERIRKLRQAASRFEEAVKISPEDYRANRGLGICLARLTGAGRDRAEQRTMADKAVEHLEKAVAADQSDGSTFLSLAGFYLGYYETLIDGQAEKKELLEEVIELARRGLEKARFSGDIARLHAAIGEAATRRALVDEVPATQRSYYLQAIEAFEAATELKSVRQQVRLNELWGIALLRTSALTKNKLYARRAIERFRFALEDDPDSTGLNYNLSCAYALLGDMRMWQKFYKRCAENDSQGMFHAAALTDPDLDGIRHTPEYEEVFGEPLEPGQLMEPRLGR